MKTGDMMSQNAERNAAQGSGPVTQRVGDLADFALSIVASRTTPQKAGSVFIDKLLQSAMGRSEDGHRAVTQQMLEMGISPEAIVDHYIPAAARRMGDEWTDDISSFAEVTIGTARLQALVRELSAVWTADGAVGAASTKGSVIVAVPMEAQHTLGASVVSTRLRREGLSVRLALGVSPDSLKAMLATGSYSAVFISSSLGDGLDAITALVRAIKNHSDGPTIPVVLGGSVAGEPDDLYSRTGAGLVTSDLDEALVFCGLEAG
ncbi:hypothetical protein DD563_04130 [Pelagicola sp. LXJ1103]|nr:hypothetical protein DD563_04130 [Pelagicola sp. LXJ1103]